jgi:hypothetical protein
MNRDIIKAELFNLDGKAIENELFRAIQFCTSLNQYELKSIIDDGCKINEKDSTLNLDIEEMYRIGKCIYFYELSKNFLIKITDSIDRYTKMMGVPDTANLFDFRIVISDGYPYVELDFAKGKLISRELMSCLPLLKDMELYDNGEKKVKFKYHYKPWKSHT